jgi:hypothetical protein
MLLSEPALAACFIFIKTHALAAHYLPHQFIA